MAITRKPAQRYYVAGRVDIGLDALNDTQKKEVGDMIIDRDHLVKEREDILPFFTAHEQLIALMGMYNPLIANLGRIATDLALAPSNR